MDEDYNFVCPQYDKCGTISVQDCPYWSKDNEHKLVCTIVRVGNTVTISRPVSTRSNLSFIQDCTEIRTEKGMLKTRGNPYSSQPKLRLIKGGKK